MNGAQVPAVKKRGLFVLLFLLIGGIGFVIWKSRSAGPISYREHTVQKGDIAVSILATGTVLPENRLEIKPPIAGRVEQVLVKEGQKVIKGQILAWMSSTERAALLDAARSRGAEEVTRWEGLYRPTPVMAPINGTIILRSIESGQTFTNADSILVMADRLTVKAQVDETDIAQVKLKQPALITLDAYPDQKIPGKVDQVAFEAKTVNNVTTYEVDVLPTTTPAFMRSGMTANVTFVLESRQDVLLIPNESLKVENGKNLVLVRTTDEQSEQREIKTGITDGKNTEVLSGITEGDKILSAQIVSRGSKTPSQGSNPFAPAGARPRGAGRGGH